MDSDSVYNDITKGASFRKIAAYHFSAFLFHCSHFPPYSIVLYPLIALFRFIADRSGNFVRGILWIAYFCFVVYFATHSYFFRYEYALAMNPVLLITSVLAACWTFWCVAKGRNKVAYVPFIILIVLNLVSSDARQFGFRFFNGDHAAILIYAVSAMFALRFLNGIRRTVVLILLFTGFFYTGNSLLPAIVMIGALVTVPVAASSGNIRKMSPAVQGFFVLHMLLTVSMAQFYSNSSPISSTKNIYPEYVTPVYIYGNAEKNLPTLAKNDNRFLSFDTTGDFLYFGTRMSRPDLFRIDRKHLEKFVSYKLKNTSDNLIVHPSGEYVVAGSFGRYSLEKLSTENFRLLKRRNLLFRPIRMRYDQKNNEIFSIGEFSGGSLFVYEADTLVEKRKLMARKEDRNFRDLVVDSDAGKIVVSQWMDLVLYDSEKLIPLSRIRTSTRGLGRMAIDTSRKIVFLTGTHSGMMTAYSYSGDTLKEIYSIKVGVGIRDIGYDQSRDLLAVANYFSGELTFISALDKQTLSSIKLGNRMRHVEFSPSGSQVSVTTMTGGYILDMDRVVSAAVPGNSTIKQKRFRVSKLFRAVGN